MKKLITITTVVMSLMFSVTGMASASSTPTKQVTQVTQGQNANIVNTAKSYIGKVKYRYGTRDTKNLVLDCSAFTQMVFKQNGITLPWGSKAQASIGTKVSSKSQLSPGDLILFSVGTPGQINHAGIYIGNGQFISNTKSSGVVITSLNTGYWSSRFIMGRHL